MIKKGISRGVCILIFVFYINPIFAQNLTYGTQIEKISVKDCFGRELVFPLDNSVTLVYFFNSNNPLQLNNLLELEFLFSNLNASKPAVNIAAISMSTNSILQSIYKKYNLDFFLINDIDKGLSKRFQLNCGSCLSVIIIDKSSKVRYLSSQFDAVFIREIVQRYASAEGL
jgi:peroxiredoxin